jgi:hypothetical protein
LRYLSLNKQLLGDRHKAKHITFTPQQFSFDDYEPMSQIKKIAEKDGPSNTTVRVNGTYSQADTKNNWGRG